MALDNVQMIGTTLLALTAGRRLFANSVILRSYGLPEPGSPMWTGVGDYLDRPWVMQEAILPANIEITCENRILSWVLSLQLNGFLESAALRSLVMMGRDSPPAGVSTATNIKVYKENSNGRKGSQEDFLGFSVLLPTYHSDSATKAEDRVHGLLELVDRELQERVSIQYGDTPVEAYQTSANAVLLSSPSFLNLLLRSGQ